MPTNLQPALYQEPMADHFVRCTLCPHDCKIAPDHRGVCGVRINHGGQLFTRVADRIVSAEVDPIEKKPLFHFLPGSLRILLRRSAVICAAGSARTGPSHNGRNSRSWWIRTRKHHPPPVNIRRASGVRSRNHPRHAGESGRRWFPRSWWLRPNEQGAEASPIPTRNRRSSMNWPSPQHDSRRRLG